MSYAVPEYNKNSFTCPHCGILAEQKWHNYYITRTATDSQFYFRNELLSQTMDAKINKKLYKKVSVSTCNACHDEHIWFDTEMVLPRVSNVPMPIEDMPENVKDIYNEARDVFSASPKAAAALLRLALQYLCIELGGKGKNINDDIGKLVEKGLPIEIQQALDVVRVIGNNAVHPGTLDLDDNIEIVAYMFKIINLIVDNQIVQKKKLNELYNSLPQNTLEAIEKRDK